MTTYRLPHTFFTAYLKKGGAPGIKLLFNAGIAALIFPLHSLFESKLKGRLSKRVESRPE